MDFKDTVGNVAEIIWDLLTDDRYPTFDRFTQDPARFLSEAGESGVSAEQFEAALGRLTDRLPSSQFVQMESLRRAAQNLSCGTTDTAVGGASAMAGGPSSPVAVLGTQVAAPPVPQVIRQVISEPNVTQRHESVTNIRNSTYQQQNVSNRYVEEGDTTVDNRVLTEIFARGDVDFDQRIDTRTVVATKGGVAVGDDLEDSAVNTGTNTGLMAGDDIELEDSIVGEDNVQTNDSELGALALGGDATQLTGENVNQGSGLLSAVASGGDAQSAIGDTNRLSGDHDVDFDRRPEPIGGPAGAPSTASGDDTGNGAGTGDGVGDDASSAPSVSGPTASGSSLRSESYQQARPVVQEEEASPAAAAGAAAPTSAASSSAAASSAAAQTGSPSPHGDPSDHPYASEGHDDQPQLAPPDDELAFDDGQPDGLYDHSHEEYDLDEQ